jgi:hypothetical protein
MLIILNKGSLGRMDLSKASILFYEAVGFKPLEETSQIWDEHNPCLIMVKKL